MEPAIPGAVKGEVSVDKIQLEIPTREFGTLNTKMAPDSKFVDIDEFTDDSQNFDTINGTIEKRDGLTVFASGLLGYINTQYETVFNDGSRDLLSCASGTILFTTGDGEYVPILSGYTATADFEFTNYQDRIYGVNGLNDNFVLDNNTSYGGVTYTFDGLKSKEMGAQPPVSGIVVPATDDGTAGSVPDGIHHYKLTFMYYDFEESNPSPASTAVTVGAGAGTVPLTYVPVGGYGVTARKVYRDNNDSIYRLIGTISNNTATTFNDQESTGTDLIPDDNGLPPVADYIINHKDMTWLFTGNSAYYSDPGFPDIFPTTNFITLNTKDIVKGVVIFNDRIIVFNRNSFGQILGETEDEFKYASLNDNIGCVDIRSIQIRTLHGIPVLLILSDKGVYSFNGSSIEYISASIEDIVNLNIQQVSYNKSSITHTTQQDFLDGTVSGGADVLAEPGLITTTGPRTVGGAYIDTLDPSNPTRTWDTTAEYEGGSSNTNLVIYNTTNKMKMPTQITQTITNGSFSNCISSGGNLVNTTIDNFTGEDPGGSSASTATGIPNSPFIAFRIRPTRTGYLSNFDIRAQLNVASSAGSASLYTDSGGVPGSQIASFSHTFTSSASWQTVGGFGSGVTLTGGTYYWLLVGALVWNGVNANFYGYTTGTGKSMYIPVNPAGSTWTESAFQWSFRYTFVSDAISDSGTWTYPVTDMKTASNGTSTGMILSTGSTSHPGGTSSTYTVQGSNTNSPFSVEVSQAFSSPSGDQSISVSGKRYWRTVIGIATTDNRTTASLPTPVLKFANSTEWISEPIDLSTGIVSLDSLTSVNTAPAGTSVALTIATSDDNSSYTSYSSVSTATPKRWVKVKASMTNDKVSTPTITSITLDYTVTGTYTSPVIDFSLTPTGYDVFTVDDSVQAPGSISYDLRSAASQGGVTGATYSPVYNGQFPTLAPQRYNQYRAVITSSSDAVPTVDLIKLGWYKGSSATPIRCASLFFDKTYYLSAAEIEEPRNNITLVYDQNDKWRVYRGNAAASMVMFRNNPFIGGADHPDVYQYLLGDTDSGTPIEMIATTKAFDLGKQENLKIVRMAWITVENTGATFNLKYSVDQGVTWYSMLTETGATSFTTSTDGTTHTQLFVPDMSATNPTSGRSVMFKVTSNDAFPAVVYNIKAGLFVRKGVKLNTI